MNVELGNWFDTAKRTIMGLDNTMLPNKRRVLEQVEKLIAEGITVRDFAGDLAQWRAHVDMALKHYFAHDPELCRRVRGIDFEPGPSDYEEELYWNEKPDQGEVEARAIRAGVHFLLEQLELMRYEVREHYPEDSTESKAVVPAKSLSVRLVEWTSLYHLLTRPWIAFQRLRSRHGGVAWVVGTILIALVLSGIAALLLAPYLQEFYQQASLVLAVFYGSTAAGFHIASQLRPRT